MANGSRLAVIARDRNQFEASPDAIDLADFQTIYDVSEQLGISPWAVQRLINRHAPGLGKVFGRRRFRYFSRADVERLRAVLP